MLRNFTRAADRCYSHKSQILEKLHLAFVFPIPNNLQSKYILIAYSSDPDSLGGGSGVWLDARVFFFFLEAYYNKGLIMKEQIYSHVYILSLLLFSEERLWHLSSHVPKLQSSLSLKCLPLNTLYCLPQEWMEAPR